MTENNKAKIIKANRSLEAKIGSGPLSKIAIERSQKIIDNNDVDFSPLAKEYLDALADAVEQAKSGALTKDESTERMTQPVMQLKANATTFKYALVGNLANVMLNFLEAIKELDNNAIEIVSAHHKTLSAIIIKKMDGDGGEIGKQMEIELKAACERYFAKT